MQMQWLHFAEDTSPVPGEKNIILINPKGRMGVLTCWNYARQAYLAFDKNGIDLDPNTSPIIAISTFYGRGMARFLRNLLYNPQVTSLVILGADLSGAGAFLERLLKGQAKFITREGNPFWQDPDTGHVVSADFPLEPLQRRIQLLRLGDKNSKGICIAPPSSQLTIAKVKWFMHQPAPPGSRKRIKVAVRETHLARRPGRLTGQRVEVDTVEEAYAVLVRRVSRMGEDTKDAKGVLRLSLYGVIVKIRDPERMSLEALEFWQQPPTTIRLPPALLLKDKPAEGVAYYYGYRLRTHFGRDQIEEAVLKIRDGEVGRIRLQIWDDGTDQSSTIAKPCMLWIDLLPARHGLDLYAYFRVHNLADAWLTNVHDLVLLQQHLAEQTGLARGCLTVESRRLSLRLEDQNHISHLVKMAAGASTPSLTRLTGVGPTLTLFPDQNNITVKLRTARGKVYCSGSSKTGALHELYRRLTDPKLCHPSPFGSLADAVKAGRLIEQELARTR